MPKLHTQRYGATIINDTLGLLLGRRLARGTYRDVYECAIDTALVVKIEARKVEFCNQTEWAIWLNSFKTQWRQWLAPCISISCFGVALVMRKTLPMHESQRPALVPNFLEDLKLENWGMFDGRPVVHDYGNHRIFDLAQGLHRMVPGRWHDGRGNKLDGNTDQWEI